MSLDNLKIINKESYLEYKPKLDTSLTKLMNGLAGCNFSKLSPDVDLITLSESCLPEDTIESASQFIYVRRFYPFLLNEIRKHDKVVLLSNPGTGKSMFQFYYLARLLNPQAFSDPLPPDNAYSSEIPEVVIRQVGTSKMQIYFVKAKVAHLVPVVCGGIFPCFDPKTTLYFFEPEESRTEPMWIDVNMPIFSCSDPDEVVYEQFCKYGGFKVYMPLFTLPELQVIGKHMKEQPNFPSDLKSLYSDEGILKSYNEYGGIIRHVLPTSLDYVKSIEILKKEAVEDADWDQYILNANVERSSISPFIVKCLVDRRTFNVKGYELINNEMELNIKKQIQSWSRGNIVALLKKT